MDPAGTTPLRGSEAGGRGKSSASGDRGDMASSELPGLTDKLSVLRFFPLGTTVSVLDADETERRESVDRDGASE